MLSNKICIQLVGSQFAVVPVDEIVSLEADRQVCYIVLADGSRLTAARHLGFYKSVLLAQFPFLEVSKSLLVNLTHVQRYLPRERTLVLSGGLSVVAAKGRQEEITRRFKDWHEQLAKTGM